MKRLALATLTSAASVALLPVVIVQGCFALRRDAQVCREADAWMALDCQRFADELRASKEGTTP